MENKDKDYMRFLAACFAMASCGDPKASIKMADELLENLEPNKTSGGIVDIVAKRKRSKS